jgi:hypothetical protein
MCAQEQFYSYIGNHSNNGNNKSDSNISNKVVLHVSRTSCQVSVIFVWFLAKIRIYEKAFFVIVSSISFHKDPPMGAQLFPADGQTW